MWERYAWLASPAFGLCLVMVPLLVARSLRAVLEALRPDAEPGR